MRFSEVYILALIFIFCVCEDPLKFAVIILRHGARSPRENLKELKDRLVWPMGKDKLTPAGQRQLQDVGKKMRTTYIEKYNLIPPEYDASQIVARSSNNHRTIMSAYSFLFGLYPDLNEIYSLENLMNMQNWTAKEVMKSMINPNVLEKGDFSNILNIPIIDYGPSSHNMLSFYGCKRYGFDRMEYYKTAAFEKVHEKYNENFQKACKLIGVSCENLKQRPVWEYVDTILTSEFDGQLPELSLNPEIVDSLERFYTEAEYGELTMEPSFQTPLAMEGFSKAIPEYFETAFNNPENPLKMAVLATHESTILALLIGLGLKMQGLYETVPYSSNLIFEMRQREGSDPKDENSYYISSLFNDQKVLDDMPLKDFNNWLSSKGVLPGPYEEICKIPEIIQNSISTSESHSIAIIFAINIILVFMGFTTSALYYYANIESGYIKKKYDEKDYSTTYP